MTSTAPASRWLLDVNVLLALAWPSHPHHELCRHWVKDHAGITICTCPITQMGFVRLSVLPKAERSSSTTEALRYLAVVMQMEQHEFWPDSLSWAEVEALQGPLRGYLQVTDAYLLALARAHFAKLITLDRGMLDLRGAERVVELLA
jgi:toxin-antitoxin system PIN domain toxin